MLRLPQLVDLRLAAFVLLLTPGVDAVHAEVVVTTSNERIDWAAFAPDPDSPLPAKTGVPSDGQFFFPWILDDTQGSLGPTTVYAIRNEGVDFSPVGVQVQFFDERSLLITSETIATIQPNQTIPRTLREKRELIDDNRVARGIARLTPTGPISVDVFEIDYANDFASGGLAFTADDLCVNWSARFLKFSPSLEGTELLFIINGPLGATNNPSIVGEIFRQHGEFFRSFSIQTDQSLVVVDSALITAGVDFGSMEIRFVTNPADGGGIISVLHRAFGKFSVGHRAICTDIP